MPRSSVVYEILIASPSDVVNERGILADVIADWNSSHSRARAISLQALRWELDATPGIGERPQDLLNKHLVDAADILIAVFGSRLGTPTGKSPSGTVEEIDRFRQQGKPVLLYFSDADVPRDHDAEQLRLLKEFRSNLQREALCFPFKDGENLRRRVTRDLASTLNKLAEDATAVATAKEHPLRDRNDLARIGIRASGRSRQLGIEVTSLTGELENLSPARRIKQYSVTLTVPRLCLSFANVNYAAEIPSNDGQYKKFRYTERNHARVAIHPGDTLQVVGGIEISVEHLGAADRTECLDLFITADAAVDDEALQVKKKVRELIQ